MKISAWNLKNEILRMKGIRYGNDFQSMEGDRIA
jgi:hypothetical protein